MKVLKILGLFAILALAGSCSHGKQDKSPGSGEAATPEPGIRVVKEYYPDGSLKSETEAMGKLRQGASKEYRKDGTLENLINYQNNRKHGPAYNYYPDGSTVKLEINYVNGYKSGETKWFYPDGNVYRVTPYVNGKIIGIRRTYYENGTLQAEMPFMDSQPGMGLKEYRQDGSPRKLDTKIVFSERDRISMDNTFRLTITLSDGSRNVEYFSGKLTDGKFWNDQLAPVRTEYGAGIMEFYVSKGTFKMETLNIVARVKTSLDNYLIIQREYHLALENKF
jgi:antitoxin component YwqK of YwqJK toxin-antitoxin module